jgi:hypothetical protein
LIEKGTITMLVAIQARCTVVLPHALARTFFRSGQGVPRPAAGVTTVRSKMEAVCLLPHLQGVLIAQSDTTQFTSLGVGVAAAAAPSFSSPLGPSAALVTCGLGACAAFSSALGLASALAALWVGRGWKGGSDTHVGGRLPRI